MSRNSRSTPRNGTKPDTLGTWELLELLLACQVVRTMYVYGPPGTGKTWSAYHKGRIETGVYALTLTEDTPAAELRGHYVPLGGNLVWRDGPFTTAMRAGARLVVNELTHGSPEVHSLLHPVLESLETARLTLPTNETVFAAPGFHVICTDNAPPEDLPESLRDRFDACLEITEPHPCALERLRVELREAARRSLALEPERRVGLRQWLALDRLIDHLDLRDACIAVFGRARGEQIYEAIRLSGQEA